MPRRIALALAALAAVVLVSTASAAKPVMVNAPSVSGLAMEGELLHSSGGTYSGAEPPFTFTYAWFRCNSGGSDCRSLGVEGEWYTATAGDVGYRLRTWVAVTGQDCTEWRRSDGGRECLPVTAQVPSELTPVIASNPNLRPQSTGVPTIAGTAEELSTLTAADGTWNGQQPMTTARQWQRCDSGGNACAPIEGATAPEYVLGRDDVSKTLRVVVTASNARGSSPAVASAPTGVVRAFLPEPGRETIGAALVDLPERLVIDRVTFAPTPARSAKKPVVVRVRVSDTRGFRIRGAVVRVAAVPGRLAKAADAHTGSDGWAKVRLRPTAKVVFRRGGSIRLLVRAFRLDEGAAGDVAAQRAAKLPLAAPAHR